MGMCSFVTIFHFPISLVRFLFPVSVLVTSLKCGQVPSERFRKEGRGVNPLFAPSDLFA